MEPLQLRAAFAYLAIVLLACPALRPMEYSVTFGDLCLVMAILLNLETAFRIQPFQIPLLAAMPFMIASQMFDPDATVVEIAQCVYVYGIVLPFGWVAFSGLAPRKLISVFLCAIVANGLIAVAQNAGLIGAFGWARIWATRDTYRAAGFSLTCSSLCMTLTPVYPLLLYLRSYRYRIIVLVIITLGILATLAKSSVFALPGLIYYLIREPNRTGVVRLIVGLSLLSVCVFFYSPTVQWQVYDFFESLSHRIGYLDDSLGERRSTLRYAMGYVPECYVIGLGYAGTHFELTQHLGNTVHVFHVGLPLIGGLVCAVLHYIGVFVLIRRSLKLKHEPLAVLMIGQHLALCTMPVLMHSFQYIPYVLIGGVIVTSQAATLRHPAGRPLHPAVRPVPRGVLQT